VRRVLSLLGGLLAGGALAAAVLWGSAVASDDGGPPSEALDLGGYCKEAYGPEATAYTPREVGGWRCSAWTNGVWRLEPVDLTEACRWQRGPDARLGALDTSERELACTP